MLINARCYCLKSGAAVVVFVVVNVKSVATLYLLFVDVFHGMFYICNFMYQMKREPKPAHFNSVHEQMSAVFGRNGSGLVLLITTKSMKITFNTNTHTNTCRTPKYIILVLHFSFFLLFSVRETKQIITICYHMCPSIKLHCHFSLVFYLLLL